LSALTAGGFRRLPRFVLVLAAVLVVGLFLLAPGAWAQSDSGLSPEDEKAARGIEGKLIAPCCYTATVAAHDSEAADMIKADIRTMISRGSSEKEIIDSFVQRYGEKILAAPAPRGFNLTAYVLPTAAVLIAAVAVFFTAARWRRRQDLTPATVAPPADDPRLAEWEERLRQELSGYDR
jgi:cytochrome c-type biogenesis protein CcmH